MARKHNSTLRGTHLIHSLTLKGIESVVSNLKIYYFIPKTLQTLDPEADLDLNHKLSVMSFGRLNLFTLPFSVLNVEEKKIVAASDISFKVQVASHVICW